MGLGKALNPKVTSKKGLKLDYMMNRLKKQSGASVSSATASLLAAIAVVQAALNTHTANTSNPHSTTKAQVGLSNVDNTSDASKPVSTAQATAIAAVQSDVDGHEADTANPHGVTKTQVGLSNADNTSDANKPVSTAQATADALVASNAASALASHVAAGDPHPQYALDTDLSGYQPLDSDISAIAALTTTPFGRSFLDRANAGAAQTLMGLGSAATHASTDFDSSGAAAAAQSASQPLNSALTSISGLSPSNDDILQRKAGAWTNRTMAQLVVDLNITSVSGNAGTATTLQTARNIDGVSFNGSADITVIAPATHSATTKATPVDADELPLVDSAASNVLKKLTWANVKATLKTYLDTLYGALASANAWLATQTITPAVNTSAIVVATQTHTANAPIADWSQTWNNVAIVYTAFKMNVTKTAGSSSSLIADWQLNGSSLFTFAQTGGFTASGGISGVLISGSGFRNGGKVFISATAPTIASGFGTSPAISSASGTVAFVLTIGTSTTGVQTGTLTMPAATTGWVCDCQNITHPDTSMVVQTGGTTTSVVLKNYARTTGTAADFTASDVIRIKCSGY